MSKYKPQHSRLTFIDKKIREGNYPNISSLAEEWEVSYKTIQRDIEYLRYQLDAPVQYSAKNRGFFYTEEHYRLPAIDIKESDLFGVYLADKLLAQYEGTPIYKSLNSVFEKIEQSLPNKISLDSASDQSKFTVVPPFTTIIDPSIWSTVISALRNDQQIEISYKTPGTDPKNRKIDPYHAIRFEGDWYIVAFCHLRGDIRTFSISRMVTARETGTVFTVPDGFDFRKISGSHFGLHWNPENTHVKIRFSQYVTDYVTERIWHPTQHISTDENGSIILSLTVNHLFELKKWILAWGEDAQVLEPVFFAEEIAATAEKILKQYSKNSTG